MMDRLKPFLYVSLMTLVALLPFVHRPLFVDDHATFTQAADLIHHWRLPYRNEPQQLGWAKGQPVGEDNPPVYFYFMAAAIRLMGTHVWKAHLAMLPISLLGILAFYALARCYVRHPLWAALLWLSCPHFWLTANSLLVDALLGPMFVMGLVCWMKGWKEKRIGWSLLSAVLLGLTPLAKYTGLLSWAVVILWTLLEGRDRKSLRWLCLLIPAALFAAWILWSRSLYGQSHFLAVARTRMAWPGIANWISLSAMTCGSTTCMLLPLLLLPAKIRRAQPSIAAALFFIYIAFGGFLIHPVAIGIQLGFWSGAFLVWLFSVIPASDHNDRSWLFLGLWALVGWVGLAFAVNWVCARFLVIIGPPLVLLTVRSFEWQAPALTHSTTFRRASLALLALFSLSLAGADYLQASVDRKVAQQADLWLQEHMPGRKGYYPGAALGGLSYYLDSKRWEGVDPGLLLQTGDVILLPWRTLPPAFLPRIGKPKILAQFVYRSWNPLRTLDLVSGGCFYGSIWAPLPFSFSRAPLEVYTLVQSR
jgi:4-amino-4-deoxy-L-arabinose transferase-like glycosyltransferase